MKYFKIWVLPATVDGAKLSNLRYLDRNASKVVTRCLTDRAAIGGREAVQVAIELGAQSGQPVAFIPCAADGRTVAGRHFQPQITLVDGSAA